MLVQNFYTVMKCLFMLRSSYSTGYDDVMPLKVVGIDGESMAWNAYGAFRQNKDIGFFDFANTVVGTNLSYEYPIICLGSGVSGATISDCKLESMISSGLTIGSVITKDGIDGSGYPFIEKTIQLIANANVTIGELGWFYCGTYSNASNKFMIDRTVLDSPLAMKKGDISFVKYRITNASLFNF